MALTHQDSEQAAHSSLVYAPPGLELPETSEALNAGTVSDAVPEHLFGSMDQLNAGDAFQAQGSFPNPWLWPTDIPLGGMDMTQMQQNMRAQASMEAAAQSSDLPMKIPVFSRNAPENETEGAAAGRENSVNEARDAEQSKQAKEQGGDFSQCRWHKSAETVGVISSDGHVFTKTAGPRRSRVSDRGARVELASICMVFDASLRCGGVHRYCYQIMEGELGAADGAGFVFDSKVRRNNIQRMRSVFLNQRGRICLRNNQQVTKLHAQLPPLTVGVCLTLLIDLDSMMARFNVSNAQGMLGGSADVSLDGLFDLGAGSGQLRSGFFCAVVTGSITIGIH
mmetsp:Transcript_20218/g.63337  ORF Transcript_20218/g.63337 Transcript_20218/m.63337 type:complete len:338 (+) Transcript_20218:90-1103(+)|eukprot:CAMPEP_0204610164 /NCGR_PEP_ID=MMETSP0661-20131031/61362_1 /ASSEMBLY_ACC=CAM_ASM_000606 /TAXON_ID=109239 /ORGANISM="Alexandrium margalefi, Strain AMGDE01CS-322" /LENGTH=337 /DNA_ID=CAMNT_0051621965 /DNA_START=90 /DNA_END=1103 /DNA_ORIENTATION=+